MTEEIIIDGVNVAGCEHYCEKLNTGSGIIQNTSKQGFCLHNITGLQNADIYFRVLSFPKCREQSNCHYKQLKRLEQERDDLKKQNKILEIQIDQCNEYIDELKQENKELKETVKDLNQSIQNCNIQRTKMYKALEEINILVKNYCNACDEFKAKTYKNKNDCLYCNYGFIKRKINEY
jgi:flagellar biosynthesis chaperone FliJ